MKIASKWRKYRKKGNRKNAEDRIEGEGEGKEREELGGVTKFVKILPT